MSRESDANFRAAVLNTQRPPHPETLDGNPAAIALYEIFSGMVAPVDLSPYIVDRLSRASMAQAQADEAFERSTLVDHIEITTKGRRINPELSVAMRLQYLADRLLKQAGVQSYDRVRAVALRGESALRIAPPVEDATVVPDPVGDLLANPSAEVFSIRRRNQRTAFAFESAADELVYIAGASLSVGLAVALFPEAGMLLSTAFLALGAAALLAQRATEPPVRAPEDAGRRPSAIVLRPVQIITLALVFVGAMFATAEVSAVAITEALGQPNGASLVIGVYAVGSFAIGLVLGALNPRMALERQLLIAVTVLAATALPLPFAGVSVPVLAAAVFVSGVAVSPTFITAFGLIERRAPAAMLTEGVTWVMTGIGIGMAGGAFITGWVVDTFGAGNGFWVSVAAGLAAVATIALGQSSLAGASSRREAVACAA